MRQTNIRSFYQLGAALQDIKQLSVGMQNIDVAFKLVKPEEWLKSFLQETDTEEANLIPLRSSRQSAEQLLKIVKRILYPIYEGSRLDATLSSDEYALLSSYLEQFESEFAHECRYLEVFTVTRKGIFDSRYLIEAAERQFSENLVKVLPQQTIEDLRQAGRCLAFELPTACAFHVCRGTEALMLRYYEVLTGQPWSQRRRNWGAYNEQLAQNGAPKSITNRLEEIREDRNSYAHPNITVSLEDAPLIFGLCNEVIRRMAKEIERLQISNP